MTLRALVQPSNLSLLFGPAQWLAEAFHAAVAGAIPGFTPLLPHGEPTGVVTWPGIDLAIVPATQAFDPLGPDQVHAATPTTVVTASSVTQTFAAIAASPEQIAATRIAAGIAITSQSAPALNGTYALSDKAQANAGAIYAGIRGGDGLPGGGASFAYFDQTNTPHAFDAAGFLRFAKAMRDYLYALSQGHLPTLPIEIG